MPDTDLLRALIRGCPRCAAIFTDNVALIASETGDLTDGQASEVLRYLLRAHDLH